MPPSVPPLPAALQAALRPFRFRFHADTWPVFLCLLTGHTTLACVRASLLSVGVTWRQCGDCFRRARWSRTAFMRATVALVLRALYPDGLPARLWWAVDTTTSDTPSARQVCGIRLCRRGCRRPGQTRTHQGHGWLLLAGVAHRRPPVAPVALCPTRPARHRAGGPVGPPAPAHPQRGQRSRPQQPATRRPGRPREYGDQARVDALDRDRLPATAVSAWAGGRWQPATAWRGTCWRKGLPVPVVIVIVATAARPGIFRPPTRPAPPPRSSRATTGATPASRRAQGAPGRPTRWGSTATTGGPSGACAAGRCCSASPTACWPSWRLAPSGSTCPSWAGPGIRARMQSGNCAGACSPPWRGPGFSCPKAGRAKDRRKSPALHSAWSWRLRHDESRARE